MKTVNGDFVTDWLNEAFPFDSQGRRNINVNINIDPRSALYIAGAVLGGVVIGGLLLKTINKSK